MGRPGVLHSPWSQSTGRDLASEEQIMSDVDEPPASGGGRDARCGSLDWGTGSLRGENGGLACGLLSLRFCAGQKRASESPYSIHLQDLTLLHNTISVGCSDFTPMMESSPPSSPGHVCLPGQCADLGSGVSFLPG